MPKPFPFQAHPGLIQIDKNATCKTALELMMVNKVHHLAVTENEDPIGVLNDRDILYRWVRGSETSRNELNHLPISLITRTHLPLLTEKVTLKEALHLMRDLGTSALLAKNSRNEWRMMTESDLLLAIDILLTRREWPSRLLAKGTEELASPMVQRLLETLAQMGI